MNTTFMNERYRTEVKEDLSKLKTHPRFGSYFTTSLLNNMTSTGKNEYHKRGISLMVVVMINKEI